MGPNRVACYLVTALVVAACSLLVEHIDGALPETVTEKMEQIKELQQIAIPLRYDVKQSKRVKELDKKMNNLMAEVGKSMKKEGLAAVDTELQKAYGDLKEEIHKLLPLTAKTKAETEEIVRANVEKFADMSTFSMWMDQLGKTKVKLVMREIAALEAKVHAKAKHVDAMDEVVKKMAQIKELQKIAIPLRYDVTQTERVKKLDKRINDLMAEVGECMEKQGIAAVDKELEKAGAEPKEKNDALSSFADWANTEKIVMANVEKFAEKNTASLWVDQLEKTKAKLVMQESATLNANSEPVDATVPEKVAEKIAQIKELQKIAIPLRYDVEQSELVEELDRTMNDLTIKVGECMRKEEIAAVKNILDEKMNDLMTEVGESMEKEGIAAVNEELEKAVTYFKKTLARQEVPAPAQVSTTEKIVRANVEKFADLHTASMWMNQLGKMKAKLVPQEIAGLEAKMQAYGETKKSEGMAQMIKEIKRGLEIALPLRRVDHESRIAQDALIKDFTNKVAEFMKKQGLAEVSVQLEEAVSTDQQKETGEHEAWTGGNPRPITRDEQDAKRDAATIWVKTLKQVKDELETQEREKKKSEADEQLMKAAQETQKLADAETTKKEAKMEGLGTTKLAESAENRRKKGRAVKNGLKSLVLKVTQAPKEKKEVKG